MTQQKNIIVGTKDTIVIHLDKKQLEYLNDSSRSLGNEIKVDDIKPPHKEK